MKRILGLLALLILSSASAYGQITLRGKIISSYDGQPIAGAYVTINASDTGFEKRTSLTDANAAFSVTSRQETTNLTISFIGHRDYYKNIDPSEGRVIDLGSITLSSQAHVTEAAIVAAQAPMAILKGDTLQYNAAAFKTNPDASSEDLLKKLPGVTTDEDGAVEVQGEKIGKVYIDGKEFFDDDPTMALKSLPADVIESMQIYDDKSDDAKFSGFDDGERIKAINIVTKSGVSSSIFGKVGGGYGTNDHYSAGGEAFIFDGDHRWAILGQSNNVNNQGFTLSDAASSMSRSRGGGGNSDLKQFTTSTKGGIRTTTMGGLNYNGEFGEKLKLSGSYSLNNVNSDQWQALEQNYSTLDRSYYDTTGSQGYNYEHRFNMRMEWEPTETNRIFFMPRINYSTNHGSSFSRSLTTLNELTSNTANNRYSTDLGTYSAAAVLYWTHRFAKAGRTLSIGGSVNGSDGWGDRTQESIYGALEDDGDTDLTTDILNQIGTLETPSFNLNTRISYSEPLSKSSRLQFQYRLRYNKTDSEILSYDWDPILDDYMTDPDPVTSNMFNRNQTQQTASGTYNFVKEKFVINAGLSYQYSLIHDDQTFPVQDDRQYNFTSLLPNVKFEYKPSKKQTMSLEYRRSTSTPSLKQLQDVIDISNPLQVYYGNPNLDESYTNTLRFRYNLVNPDKSTNLNIYASAYFREDYIANHRIFLTEDKPIHGTTVVKGAQVSTPMNMDGYSNANIFMNYSFRITPLKSNMSIGARYMYSKTPSMEDNVEYMTNNNKIGGYLSLTSNISENIDFTIAYYPSINFTTSEKKDSETGLMSKSEDRYITSNLSGRLNIFLWKGLFINADASWRNSFGTQESYEQHYALVNAGIGYKFLKHKQAEVRLTAYDLLNENQAFRQSSNATYIQTTMTNILQQYFMVTFSYKFDTRKGRSSANYGESDKKAYGGRHGGGGRRKH